MKTPIKYVEHSRPGFSRRHGLHRVDALWNGVVVAHAYVAYFSGSNPKWRVRYMITGGECDSAGPLREMQRRINLRARNALVGRS